MGIKTVSLKQEAYDRLKAARRYPAESFSEVVLRSTWPEDTVTASALLAMVRSSPRWFEPDELDAIEAAKSSDAPPEDKWAAR